MSWSAVGIVVLLAVVYAVLGHRYTPYWTSDRTIWPYAAALNPMNPIPVINAAMVNRK